MNTNDSDIPEDLRDFRDAMAARGITVSLPTLDANQEWPEPLDIPGVSLSETIIQMRREPR